MSHDHENALTQEFVENNSRAADMAAINGDVPFYVTQRHIDNWSERIHNGEPVPFPMPHLGYHNPDGWERIGAPMKVDSGTVAAPWGSMEEDVLSIAEFIESLTPGWYAIGEFRDIDIDLQQWQPIDPAAVEDLKAVNAETLDRHETVSPGEMLAALLGGPLGLDGTTDPCDGCPDEFECSEEKKAAMREVVGFDPAA